MKIIFSFIICIISIQAYSSNIIESRKFGNYKVIVKWQKFDEELDYHRLIILHKGKVVYTEGELGTSIWIGNHFDESLSGKDPYSGKDINGNGIPDLVVTKWNGGAHCCNFLSVFELGDTELKKLITVDGGSYYFQLKDFDRDKIPEIEFWDWPIDYLFNSFADSAQGRVFLKFINGKYHVSSRLMYRKRPNKEHLDKLKAEIKRNFRDMGDKVPYELLNIMMELSYTGYKELAIKLAEETWPKDRRDLDKFKKEFKSALKNSNYWSEFIQGKY